MEKETVSEDEKIAQEEAATAEAEQEATVYQQELAKLKAEKEQAEAGKVKAEEIAKQKSGAIAEEREKRKAAEAAAKALAEAPTVEDLDKRLEQKLNERDFSRRIKEVSSDPDEQALIKHHYETSIIKTGDVETDLARAVAIANAHHIDQARQIQAEREQREAEVAGFQGGSPKMPKGKPAYETDPVKKAAADLLKRMGRADSVKYL